MKGCDDTSTNRTRVPTVLEYQSYVSTHGSGSASDQAGQDGIAPPRRGRLSHLRMGDGRIPCGWWRGMAIAAQQAASCPSGRSAARAAHGLARRHALRRCTALRCRRLQQVATGGPRRSRRGGARASCVPRARLTPATSAMCRADVVGLTKWAHPAAFPQRHQRLVAARLPPACTVGVQVTARSAVAASRVR
jgi:hypothetical protein